MGAADHPSAFTAVAAAFEGVCGTIEELAKRERVNHGCASRALRLTLLAPDIVEAILDGRQPQGMRLDDMLEGFRWSGTRSANGWRSTARNSRGLTE